MIVTDQLARDEETHTYWEMARQRRVVGVTELLHAHGYIDGNFAKEEHMRRGKNVHLAIHYHEKHLLGDGGGIKLRDLAPHLQPYFTSYLNTVKLIGARPLLTETFVFDPLVRLACQLDSVWAVNDEFWVVDYKTGPVYEWVKYQTAAAVNGLELDRPFRRFGLQLMADGSTAMLTEFKEPDNLRRVRQFASDFYQWVEDKIHKWPETWNGLLKSKEQENGNTSDDFFPDERLTDERNDNGTPEVRDSEGTARQDQGVYPFAASPI